MADEASASRLAWSWGIEALARSDDVDPALLYDLIGKMPELYEHMGENTREAVALRCLESLFVASDGLEHENIHSTHSRTQLDSSKSCEEVLYCLSKEVPLSTLRKHGSERLKWDVQSFIEHKNDSLPKCALNQLKDTILQGTHPLAQSLKEASGLMLKDTCNKEIPPEDGEKIAQLTRQDEVGVNGEATLAKDSPSLQNGNKLGEGKSEKLGIPLSKKRDGTSLSNGISGPNSLKNFDDGGLHQKKLKYSTSCSLPEKVVASLSKKREKACLSDGISDLDSPRNFDNGGPQEKKLKHSTSCSSHEPEGHLDTHGIAPSDGPSGNMLRVDVDVEASGTPLECMNGRTLEHDSNEQAAVLGAKFSCQQLVPGEDVDARGASELGGKTDGVNEHRDGSDDQQRMRMLDGVPSGEHNERMTATENQEKNVLMEPRPEKITSNGKKHSVEAQQVPTETGVEGTGHSRRDKEIDVDKEKDEFLSSQQCLDQLSLTPNDWTGQSLCMRCNNGGELLSCSSKECPVSIHESCMRFSATLDSRGRFYCPFCAYSRAISEYRKAKKKVSLARKELSLFIGGNSGSGPADPSRTLPKDELSLRKSAGDTGNRDEGDHAENFANSPKDDIVGKGLAPCSGGTASVEDGNLEVRGTSFSLSEQRREKTIVTEKQPFNESNGQRIVTEVGPRHDTTQESDGNESPIFVNNSDVGARINHVVSSATIPSQSKDAPSANGLDRSPEDDHCTDAESSQANEDPAFERQAGNGIEVELGDSLQPVPDHSRDAPCESISDPDGFGDWEHEVDTPSRYIFKRRQRKDHIPYEGTLQLRRKPVPWTVEEEEMLKEAMKRFTDYETKVIPWRTMLEFGSSVFLKCRTAGDLKDKWKNMQKKQTRAAKKSRSCHG